MTKEARDIKAKVAKATERLLKPLPERTRAVLSLRYGLADRATHETLEAIGEVYDITRERVRQIEKQGLAEIRGGAALKAEQPVLDAIAETISQKGCVIEEDELLSLFGDDEKTKNQVHFLLVVGDAFSRTKEDEAFYHRWQVDSQVAGAVEGALHRLYEGLSDTEVVEESAMMDRFLAALKEMNAKHRDAANLRRWLNLSKLIDCNQLGEWGRASSPAIRARGIRDYAYLAMKRTGKPMHFRDVAKEISRLFKIDAHVATTHNELIKDTDRFVLVGRGLYALREWGYERGVVRDVIRDIIEKGGPMTRAEIIERVRKVRHVKDNTISVNLSNRKHFTRLAGGKYAVTK